MNKQMIMQNTSLLERAKEVFGEDLIVNAFYMMTDDASNYRELLLDSKLYHEDPNAFSITETKAILEFSNGNKIVIETDNWVQLYSLSEDATIRIIPDIFPNG